jgi:hypothetical protein
MRPGSRPDEPLAAPSPAPTAAPSSAPSALPSAAPTAGSTAALQSNTTQRVARRPHSAAVARAHHGDAQRITDGGAIGRAFVRSNGLAHHGAAHGRAHGRAHFPVLARADVLGLFVQQPLRRLCGWLQSVQRPVPADGLAHGRALHIVAHGRTHSGPDVSVRCLPELRRGRL